MRKLFLLLLLIPLICWGQFDAWKNVPRLNIDNTWSGCNCFLGDVMVTYLEVDSVVVVYENSTYVDADSVMLCSPGRLYFGDTNDYLTESSDGVLDFYLGGSQITRINSTGFTSYGRTYLGDASTDTVELYGVSNHKAISYWGSGGYITASSGLQMVGITATSAYYLPDAARYWIGNGTSAVDSSAGSMYWHTSDADANCWAFRTTEGGTVDVPVWIFTDSTAKGKDFGWFDGVTEPRIAITDDDVDSWLGIGHTADDKPALMIGGANKSLTLPNALTLQLHTIAAGDSVFLNTIVDAADSILKIYNGSTWVAVQDLTP